MEISAWPCRPETDLCGAPASKFLPNNVCAENVSSCVFPDHPDVRVTVEKDPVACSWVRCMNQCIAGLPRPFNCLAESAVPAPTSPPHSTNFATIPANSRHPLLQIHGQSSEVFESVDVCVAGIARTTARISVCCPPVSLGDPITEVRIDSSNPAWNVTQAGLYIGIP